VARSYGYQLALVIAEYFNETVVATGDEDASRLVDVYSVNLCPNN
jgi:hypothetical protein